MVAEYLAQDQCVFNPDAGTGTRMSRAGMSSVAEEKDPTEGISWAWREVVDPPRIRRFYMLFSAMRQPAIDTSQAHKGIKAYRLTSRRRRMGAAQPW